MEEVLIVETVGGLEYQRRQQEEEEEFRSELWEDKIVVVDTDLRHGALLAHDGVDKASE